MSNKTAFLFAGQGAQYAGMGKELYEVSPAAKAVFDMGDNIRPGTMRMCFEGPGDELIRTVNTQPCLFLTDLACARALEEKGVSCDAVAGFSLGEIPALSFSGILSDEDAFRLVTTRGKSMDECALKTPGGMAACMKLPNEKVEEIAAKFTDIYPVNYNCPGQLVCAGAAGEIDAFIDAIKAEGGRAVKLSVSGAFHTRFMEEARMAVANELSGKDINTPQLDIYSNLTGKAYPKSRDEVINTVASQLCNPVRWETIIRTMYADGVRTFIEVGPGSTLSGLMKKIALEDVEVMNVADARSLEKTVIQQGLS